MFGSLSTSLIALLATAAIASPQGWPSGGASSQGWSSGQPCKPTKSAPAATTTSAPSGPSSSPYANSTNPDGPPYLNDLAKAKGKLWFGSATDQPGTGEDTDIAYQTILNNTDIFGQLTPANYMKFFATEPEQNVFNYTGGDVVLDIAEDHGKLVRCHNLIWSNQLSDWVTNGNWTAETLTAAMKNHIQTIIAHWGDRCYSWDVINEALASNGTFSESIWYDVIGPEYFFLAFQFAQETVEQNKLKVKLFYNDYGIETPGNKSAALSGLISEAQSRGIRIDGVGLESHFALGEPTNPPPTLASLLTQQSAYASLGIEIAVTELDVRFNFTDPDYTNAYNNYTSLGQQAQVYYDSVSSCMQTVNCIGVTQWDFDDEYSWIPNTFAGEGGADIYTNTTSGLVRKPAYYACADAIEGIPCGECA